VSKHRSGQSRLYTVAAAMLEAGASSSRAVSSTAVRRPVRGNARPQVMLPLTIGLLGSITLLAGCTNGIMAEEAAIATATACGCNCFPYGSRQYTVPTRTPTPTGTWIPPRPTNTPTPTRPSGGSYATLVPAQPAEPPAWPPPAVTCTAAPYQPTLTPRPTIQPPVFPTLPVNTPMPSGGSGTSEGRALASMSGNAGVGQPAVDPGSGAPSFIWSQDNTNQATDAEHRVYLRQMDPRSRTLLDARTVNILEPKVGFKATYLDSAVAITPDGAFHVLYCERRAGTGLTDALYRRSPDGNGGWSEPLRIGEASPSWCNNVRLKSAPDGALLAAWTGGNPYDTGVPDSFVRVWRRSAQGEWADVSPPRMTNGRQFESDIAFLELHDSMGDGSGGNADYRAFLIFDDGANVYATYSDPEDGGYWHEPVELVNSAHMNGTLGIRDYWPSSLRLLSFRYASRAFIYAFWSIYSTGRIGYVYSSDADGPGAPRWTAEDTFAYFPPVPGEPEPTPPPEEEEPDGPEQSGPAVGPGAQAALAAPKVHMPQPFWVPERSRVFVVYRYGTSPPAEGGIRQYFAAYAYSLPDAPGPAWEGAVGPQFDHTLPLRAFPPTQYEAMNQLQGTGTLDATGAAWLAWMEKGPSKEAFLGAIWPYTLISADNQP
jgi:hypothetical protein